MKEGIYFILIGAIAWEVVAALDVSNKSSNSLKFIKNEVQNNLCDKINTVKDLTNYTHTKTEVQWRRAFICAYLCALGLEKLPDNLYVKLMMVWILFILTQSFVDYHMRSVSLHASNQILDHLKQVSGTTCTHEFTENPSQLMQSRSWTIKHQQKEIV